jgi:death on curing protein
MSEPVWVSVADCLSLQQSLLARFGGLAGVRDEGLLHSALDRPRNLAANGKPTLFDLAAAYACGIVKNHPFLDGNKRAGFVTAALFLELNGCDLQAPEEAVVVQTRALASGDVGEEEYARWLEDSCK